MAEKKTKTAAKPKTGILKAAKKTKAEKTQTEKVFFSNDDAYLFGQGVHYDIYKKLGSHPSEEDGKKGQFFGVWAPHAKYVAVTGEFNGWDTGANPLSCENEVGVWTGFIPEIEEGAMYKYYIVSAAGEGLYKADPYAAYAEERPGTASRTFDISRFKWKDGKWMDARAKKDMKKEPMAIYILKMTISALGCEDAS